MMTTFIAVAWLIALVSSQFVSQGPRSGKLVRGNLLRDGKARVFPEAGQLSYRPARELTGGRRLS